MNDRYGWEERREAWNQRDDDARTAYEVDYARVLHSSSFRRLGAVTQVISGEGGLQRTRLTHSLEVQQIAEGICQRFRRMPDLPAVLRTHVEDPSLIRVIALSHDLGHPPLGHAGEEALNCMMRDRGNGVMGTGFEGNGQTIRILTHMEDFSEACGSNLTRRMLLGTLKYPVPYSDALKKPVPPPLLTETGVPLVTHQLHAPPKCYLDSEREIVAWMLSAISESEVRKVVAQRAKSVDATLMDRSDDLAYSFGDLSDAISLDLLKREHLAADVPPALWDDYIEYTRQRYTEDLFGDATGYDGIMENLFSGNRTLQKQIGRLTGYGIGRTRIRERGQFSDPLYAHEIVIETGALALVEALKRCIFNRVINSPRLQHGRLMGQMEIVKVFDVMRNSPRHHLPELQHRRYVDAGCDDRVICDWLAGSSEVYISRLYQRIFMPGAASITDRL